MKTLLLLNLLLAAMLVPAADFDPKQVVRPFQPIENPKIASMDQAGKWVTDEELVLGVNVQDQARAYPINQLTNPTREIINDTLGDVPIAATW